jgi:hypothetical protein
VTSRWWWDWFVIACAGLLTFVAGFRPWTSWWLDMIVALGVLVVFLIDLYRKFGQKKMNQ